MAGIRRIVIAAAGLAALVCGDARGQAVAFTPVVGTIFDGDVATLCSD